MKRPQKLSAAFVKTVKRPGRYGDGRGGFGLSLLVKPTTTGRLSKTWSQRLRINGHPVNVGLGSYPVVTLAEAETVIAIHRPSWRSGKYEALWRGTLRNHAMPRLGHKRVNEITTADVIGVLLADDFSNRKRVTARVVRQRIGAVMKWAVAQGYREDNPAGDAISAGLPKNSVRVRHQRALPHGAVAAALARVRASDSLASTKLALEFLVLTACRSGGVRNARWSEINLKEALWTIPGDRTKSGRKHRVPRPRERSAFSIKRGAVGNGTGLVFPGRRGRPLAETTHSLLLRRFRIQCVPHGMRSSFRDWCSETGVRREVAEAALAHVVRNKVEAAYARSDLIDQRREVMEA